MILLTALASPPSVSTDSPLANRLSDAYHASTMLSVKISTKHQIAVPSEARKKLGLKAGDRLDVEIEGDV
ncbi:MAG TPA: AbrB/MazE/SpoVT family DNA-binding domain-containing protein, partial [Desulfobacterales bacterium]|nr:AbrB/MazE/SpoVT family DNA-binding domain-containing protein [Desulfobacterales bacterium]